MRGSIRNEDLAGWEHPGVPGLAVCERDEGWSITHIRSGLCLFTVDDPEQAVAAMVDLAGAAAWTDSAEEIRAQLGPVAPEAVSAVRRRRGGRTTPGRQPRPDELNDLGVADQ